MKETLATLTKRVKLLQKALKKARSEQESFPPGRLRVSNNGRNYRLHNVSEKGCCNGVYITLKDRKLATLLAQKGYNGRFIKMAEKELSILENTIAKLSTANADIAYQTLHSVRKELIIPYIKSDEYFANEWSAKPYLANHFMEDEKKYDTRRGEKVRSKSEAILADMLYELSIPYHYEAGVHLKDGTVKYPDFTLLKVRTREEIYLEHLGLLDDEEYRRNNLKKLDIYRENGIYLGKNLLITYETKDSPLDIRGIRRMLKGIFLQD